MLTGLIKNTIRGVLFSVFVIFSAMAATENAIEKKEEDPQLQQIAQLMQQEKWQEAEALWRRLQGRVPEQRWYYNLAQLLVQQGKLEEAAQALEQALQVRQPEAQIWQALKQVRTAQMQQAYTRVFGGQAMKQPEMQWLKVVQLNEPPASIIEVRQALESWRKAWSAQDVEVYLSHYAPDFRPASGLSHQAWIRLRHARLSHPKFIRVTLKNIQVTQLTPKRIETLFDQTYRSDRLHDTVRKRLLWAHTQQGWKIVQEVVLP